MPWVDRESCVLPVAGQRLLVESLPRAHEALPPRLAQVAFEVLKRVVETNLIVELYHC